MLSLKFSTVSLIGHVNVENVSTVDVENLSVANSDSHELVTVLNKWVSIKWISLLLCLNLPVGNLLGISLQSLLDSVGVLILFNLTEWVELIKSLLSDWNHVLDNIPQDTLRARDGGQRSLVSPSSVEVEKFNEFFEIKGSSILSQSLGFKINHFREESIMVIDIDFWVPRVDLQEVLLWHALEEEAQHSIWELGVDTDLVFALNLMDNMHFQIH